MGSRRVAITPLTTYQPLARKYSTNQVVNKIKELMAHFKNYVAQGLLIGTPTTASTQGAGVGNTDWNVNIAGGIVVVDSVAAEIAAAVDYNIHTGSLYTGLVSGNSAIATVVAKNTAGTITVEVVKGTAAVTGAQVAPSDSEINTAMGAGNNWVKLAECTLNRTGDATVTQSEVNILRPLLGVTVGTTVDITA